MISPTFKAIAERFNVPMDIFAILMRDEKNEKSRKRSQAAARRWRMRTKA